MLPANVASSLDATVPFRHTFSTWLEDAGIPAREIDRLMGHRRGRRSERDQGSEIGIRYRHTTPTMEARIVAAIEERLTIVLTTAARLLPDGDNAG